MSNFSDSTDCIVEGIGLRISTVTSNDQSVTSSNHLRLEAWFSKEKDEATVFQKLRTIFLVAISDKNQVVYHQNFLKDRVLFNEDTTTVVIDDVEYFKLDVQFDIRHELDIEFSGLFYMQASAITHASNTLCVQIS